MLQNQGVLPGIVEGAALAIDAEGAVLADCPDEAAAIHAAVALSRSGVKVHVLTLVTSEAGRTCRWSNLVTRFSHAHRRPA